MNKYGNRRTDCIMSYKTYEAMQKMLDKEHSKFKAYVNKLPLYTVHWNQDEQRFEPLNQLGLALLEKKLTGSR